MLLIKGIVGSAGIPWVLAGEIGLHGDDEAVLGPAVNSAFWLNNWSGLALALIIGVIATSFASWADVAVLAGTTFVLSLSSTGMGYLQGFGKTGALALINTIEVVVKLGVGLALVFAVHLGSAGALSGALAGAFVPLVTLPLYWRWIGRPTLRGMDRSFWRSAWTISALQIGVGILSAADSILVAVIPASAAGAGSYQVAATLGRVPLYVSNAVSTAVFPTLRRPDGAKRYAAGLASYLYVGGFIALTLVTVPDRLLNLVFPKSFQAVSTWLPYTACLGLLIGLLNVVVTRLQAEERAARAIVLLSLLTGVYLGSMAIAADEGGVRGLAWAAVLSLLLSVVVIGAMPAQWPALRILAGMLGRPRVLAVAVVYAVAMALIQQPVVWVLLAAAAATTSMVAAFPELLVKLPSRARPRPKIAGP